MSYLELDRTRPLQSSDETGESQQRGWQRCVCISNWRRAGILIAFLIVAIVGAGLAVGTSFSGGNSPECSGDTDNIAAGMKFLGGRLDDTVPTPMNTKVAFIADTTLNSDTQQLYGMIKDERVEALFIQGDLDYYNDPDGWDQQLTDTFGEDFPVFISLGNNDDCMATGYQDKVTQRLFKAALNVCEGILGVTSTCLYKGILFVQTEPGGPQQLDYATYIDQQMSAYNTTFKVCLWHRNMYAMQNGDKPDETGWPVYQTCLKHGAFVITGHDHSYCRSYVMSSFEQQQIAGTYPYSRDQLTISPGNSFVVVNGLGGKSGHTGWTNDPWWATDSTKKNDITEAGAVFCSFNWQNVQNTASCYFKDIRGITHDTWTIVSRP